MIANLFRREPGSGGSRKLRAKQQAAQMTRKLFPEKRAAAPKPRGRVARVPSVLPVRTSSQASVSVPPKVKTAGTSLAPVRESRHSELAYENINFPDNPRPQNARTMKVKVSQLGGGPLANFPRNWN